MKELYYSDYWQAVSWIFLHGSVESIGEALAYQFRFLPIESIATGDGSKCELKELTVEGGSGGSSALRFTSPYDAIAVSSSLLTPCRSTRRPMSNVTMLVTSDHLPSWLRRN